MYKGKRIFVSFHHEKNQKHAEIIRNLVKLLGHIDISVNEGTKVENEEYNLSLTLLIGKKVIFPNIYGLF